MARDFVPNESLENLGILDVFQVFQTAQLEQKIRQPPKKIDSGLPQREVA
jgi:hypothetical protein